jgi:hypothetical protein
MDRENNLIWGGLRESNADAVVSKVIGPKGIDPDGTRLVEVLRLLLLRAEQLQNLRQRFDQFDQQLSAGHLPEQTQFNAEVQDGLYEPLGIKWFLARAFGELSEQLEYEVYVSQHSLRPIRSIVYGDNGNVDSFLLDVSDVGNQGGA